MAGSEEIWAAVSSEAEPCRAELGKPDGISSLTGPKGSLLSRIFNIKPRSPPPTCFTSSHQRAELCARDRPGRACPLKGLPGSPHSRDMCVAPTVHTTQQRHGYNCCFGAFTPSLMLDFLFRAKLITQRFYACLRSAAEGDHPLQDTHQHGGWITRPRLVPAVPHRRCQPTPASSPRRGGSQRTLDLVEGAWHQAVPIPSSALPI